MAGPSPICAARRLSRALCICCRSWRPEFVGSENTGIAGGGGGVETGGVDVGGPEPGGALTGGTDVVGAELVGVRRGCVVVVTGAVDGGDATVVDVGGGVTPYAAAGAESDATRAATRTTPPREHLNIGSPLGIRATDLQRSPQ